MRYSADTLVPNMSPHMPQMNTTEEASPADLESAKAWLWQGKMPDADDVPRIAQVIEQVYGVAAHCRLQDRAIEAIERCIA